MSVLPLLVLLAPVQADTALPDLAVVGLHAPGAAAPEALRELVMSLEDTGRVDVVAPGDVARRIEGRESLILSGAFLGPGQRLLEEGRILYERADPEQAIPILEEAVRALGDGMAYATDNRPLADALLVLGFAQLVVGDDQAARETFGRVVILDPGRELDTVNYAPRIVEFYNDVRDEVLAAGTGALEVDAVQEGAQVYLDGRRLGTTPLVVGDLPVGRHFLLVTGAQGYRTFGMVTIQPGKRSVIRANLDHRALADPAEDPRDQERQVSWLYRSLGEHVRADLVLLGGITPEGDLGLQLYSTRSGTFSKPLTTQLTERPGSAAADLAPALAAFVTSTGDIRGDKAHPQALVLDISANEVLADLLLDPSPRQPTEPVVLDRPSRWYLWTGAGVLAAGGAAAATWAVLSQEPPEGDTTITVGPIP